ncbi:hypothetical protein HUJ05_004361 [Dendroctonus ponderosae]|nr:hypothetical protein HUJ05_004361 [Dendroctonus ponderosae]
MFELAVTERRRIIEDFTANSPCFVDEPQTRYQNGQESTKSPLKGINTHWFFQSIKYGPGHEKFPSWPVPAAAEASARASSGGGSSRSKSWTDHTNYPKEKTIAYTRPHMKRQHSQYTQQKLKTVMERCEKIPPETFESRQSEKLNERLFLPNVDHDGKPLGDVDYSVPSPPEREYSKPQLTQKDLEEYARSYQEPVKFEYETPQDSNHRLTESGLEEFMEYNRNYEESLFSSLTSKHEDGILTHIQHQKQVSYAQSEGYHSYVSSTDSTSTPFLDRLRRDSDAVVSRPHSSTTWEEESSCSRREGRDSVVTTSSGSASSSETLKWHGSMSDVSVASSSCTHLASPSSSSSRQLIAHSARVQTPQRHHSESVLYMSGQSEGKKVPKEGWPEKEKRNNSVNKLKLFPVNTYTVQDGTGDRPLESSSGGINNSSKNSELEKQQKYSYLDPNKKHKVPDPTLKAIQKKALLSFYERHQQNGSTAKNPWRSEPQLADSQQPLSVPQATLPKVRPSLPSRRASSASDYASANNSKRSSLASSLESRTTDHIGNGKSTPRHQHSNSCGSLSTDLLGPVIVGQAISVDDYVPEKPPERPPKNPNLRTAFPDLYLEQRVPSPDLPPPSPPTVFDQEILMAIKCARFNASCQYFCCIEKFVSIHRLKSNSTSSHQIPQAQVQKPSNELKQTALNQNVGIPERSMRYSLIKTRPTDHIIHQVSSKPYQAFASDPKNAGSEEPLGFPSQRGYAERSSTRYPSTQKLVLNGNVAVSQKVKGLADQHRPEPLKSTHRDEFKKQAANAAARIETHRAQRASIAESPVKEAPPPLQPRHMRINQSMRAKPSHDHRSRMSPPKEGLRESRSSSL